ncbi:hypothetical protein [Nostoc commune]|uniref:hypothetical protein n=1 Tax=Nostoc commune TaxID=1178 RepID=UPI0018C58780|nr:hypothetical protein [Nostoc commune]
MENACANEVQTFVWIQTRPVYDLELVEALSNELDIGEAEAMSDDKPLRVYALAVEMKADQVLIDERSDRMVAARLNLSYTGILGSLIALLS